MVKFFTRSSFYDQSLGYPPFKILASVYLSVIGTSLLLFWWLIPEFPLWIAAVSIAFGFLISLIATRATGEVGFTITVPYMWQVTVYASSYQGLAGWLFTPAISYGACSSWVQWAKAGDLLETRPRDLFKALAIGFILANFFGLVAMEIFWRIAPIPSSMYPFTILDLPVRAVGDALWATRQMDINFITIVLSIAVSIGICAFGELLGHLGITFSTLGLITGTFWLPPYVITAFIGSSLGKFVFPKVLGKERWEATAGTIVAGAFTGLGIVLGFSIAIAFLTKAAWVWPW
jgi:hypothetical protein